MSKSIDNLNLTQMLELKTAADLIVDYYSEMLTDYASINADPTFQRIPERVRQQYEKRSKAKELSCILREKIEDIISEYYD